MFSHTVGHPVIVPGEYHMPSMGKSIEKVPRKSVMTQTHSARHQKYALYISYFSGTTKKDAKMMQFLSSLGNTPGAQHNHIYL
mmetsp:Transcript_36891/g.65896  ORF Transcript_36891/g.65896 Transcript_36891/m.65896 type:complete len:83 (-) Transcript_36891:374-622(-)